jgi:uncharacterized protein YwqG
VTCLGCSDPSPPTVQSAAPSENFTQRPNGKGAFPPELESFRAAVEKSRKDYVAIKVRKADNTAQWSSKFRGTAYWPKGMEFPTDPRGRPLILLAQINFAEMPSLEGYPDRGILQFFISGEESRDHVWGAILYDEQPYDPKKWFASLQDDRYFRVVYHDKPIQDESQLVAPPQPVDRYYIPIMEEAQLSFEKRSEPVLPGDYEFRKVFGKEIYDFEEDVANRYMDFAYAWTPAKIGGYSSFTQRDPREAVPQDDWLLLMEIQSGQDTGGVEVMWGDAGVGGLFIRESDLAKRDFSSVAYYWDNH